MRIISICPSNTELIWFLGAADKLVGLDDWSDWPVGLGHLPRVGPDLDIDMDKVKALKPDLVIASLSVPGMEKNVERLEREKIPHVVLNPTTFADIAEDLGRLGAELGMPDRGKEEARRFLEEVRSVASRIPKNPAPVRLYWEWWPKPVFTPGGRNWLTELSRLAGAVNVFEDEPSGSVRTDWEEVKRRRPDRVLAVWTGVPSHRVKPSLITSRPAWQGEPFAEESRVHILEEGWYCRPSPRLLTGLKHLAHLLYPDRFRPVVPDDPYASNHL
ncbi:cobalamin-binding protein [Staphylospora marina]|uniref:cobalamin-binding protein n=1 Tax=Staphylospora marina TaxID=2490858 RepID=UPI000F5BF0CB|nr:cobalamin-binding protein [Staphylospora marina]